MSQGVEIPSYEIVVASSKEEQQQCYEVRVNVFHYEQKFPLECELDDKEDISTHILLRLTPSMEPIGTIRGYLVPGRTDTYKLTRLAVTKEYRKYGFGRKLVEALHQWIRSHVTQSNALSTALEAAPPNSQTLSKTMPPPNLIKVISHSQIYAKGFYARFGYIEEGEEFMEDGDPHQKMVLHIPIN
ncbi:hypothetical protein AGABI1DRAFT_119918 [Agaricus bisporus var. burnettii JB137-S8]|uniref:N-acetyltransferase domain-containing protein n=1 Tax=Agaricus bisporus var. burnettii (strain JB137-S8 / ATCC MYA-4627 / FGSC 10392) TaxID=597362 RepID=K5X9F3_AGABU|nr:uncharacterized protein AGABI1DRAFT_119918 [Agaricus bisporus var. burnettii JB137-S8]EKM79858.1 hypothetical protein AGABI1DRAFT_119918 [Agaricus bisporus var. burnettii JB137-S8]